MVVMQQQLYRVSRSIVVDSAEDPELAAKH
jgi:hypothetical protein